MAKLAAKRRRVPGEYFPCPNCVILVSQDYPSCQFKLVQSKIPGDTMVVLKEGIPVKRIKVAELTPACRLCKGYSLLFGGEIVGYRPLRSPRPS